MSSIFIKVAVVTLGIIIAIPVMADELPSEVKNNYGVAGFGPMFWPDRSNTDEVESGSEPGLVLSIAIGHKFFITPDFDIRGEIEATSHTHDLHGRNDVDELSADGQTFQALGIGVNVWPTYKINKNVGLYAGGGVGIAELNAFSDSSVAAKATAGAGVWMEFGDYTVDVGGRYFVTNPTRLDGARATYDSFGPMIRFGLKF